MRKTAEVRLMLEYEAFAQLDAIVRAHPGDIAGISHERLLAWWEQITTGRAQAQVVAVSDAEKSRWLAEALGTNRKELPSG